MSQVVIKVENLGKKYLIRHQQREPYTALRDVLSTKAKSFGKKLYALCSSPSALRPSSEEFWALKDVSFEIKQGDRVGVIGRNGAGKTTLLKLLSRITEPSAGRIAIKGRVASLLEVGTGFHPELTGRENIFLNGAILGMTKQEIKKKFAEIVDFAEVGKFLDTPVKRYSSGMYVRLAFAVAAHLEPEILLVDEVLAVGDAQFQKKCLGKMEDVSAKEGRTVIFVSHNMGAIQNLCKSCLLLRHGVLERAGSSLEMIQAYLNGDVPCYYDGNLESIKRRTGVGDVRFTELMLVDENGRTVLSGTSGKPIQIILKYRSRYDSELSNPRLGIAVHDTFGSALFVCSTEMIIREHVTLPPNGQIVCTIPELPLSRGKYLITLFLEVNHIIQDWLMEAVSFFVEDGDFFGTGRNYPDGWAGKGTLVRHSWKFEIVDR